MKPIKRDSGRDPIRRFKDEFDSMFDRFFREPFFSENSLLRRESFSPLCNVKEEEKRYLIEAEIPGVDPDDIEIEIEHGQISIRGTKKANIETKDEDRQMHVIERSSGSFYRAFTLPDNVDTEQITADYKNGILYIDIPKTRDKHRRRIKIRK